MERTFKCCRCGDEFTIFADYFIPGINGFINDGDGNSNIFVDPTNEDMMCPTCVDVLIGRIVEVGDRIGNA